MKRLEMVGKTYGRLLVTKAEGRDFVTATCECGIEKEYRRGNVLAGYTKSCGCYRDEQISAANGTHRLTGSRTYISWQAMKTRCNNPDRHSSHRYKDRGITYAPRWEDFEAFYEDMGSRPADMELDRIDNNDDYYKDNCRWSTHQDNVRNRGY